MMRIKPTFDIPRMIWKGFADGTKTVVVSVATIMTIAKIIEVEITNPEAVEISVIIGGLSGVLRMVVNWYKNGR